MDSGGKQLQRFGGLWTEKKLNVLAKYLCSYTTALKNQPFTKVYIDAFAGTGYRELKADDQAILPLFAQIAEEAPQKFLDGSARIALRTKPSFDQYLFIEKSRARAEKLEKLRSEPDWTSLADSVYVRCGESNELLRRWCDDTDWKDCRAVVFLDPFGMQVDWNTVQTIAKTGAIDTWILFPLGMAVNRMLADDLADIPSPWQDRLTKVFGDDRWRGEFYHKTISDPLFDTGKTRMRKGCALEQIGSAYHRRLQSIFPAVARNPAILRNSTRSPLFQFHFAAANAGEGGKIALRIAEHLLKGITEDI